MARPSQPTGLTTEASANAIVVRWIANPESDIKGYNVYNSTTSGGGVSGYVKLNNELVSTYEKIQDVVIDSSTNVTIAGTQKTTTIVEEIEQQHIFAYTHIDLLEDVTQYYVITAVNNTNEESLYSVEIFDEPMILSTTVVNFPVRTSEDVGKSMINRVLDRQPNVDIKPGTMTRDLHIDPHAAEFESLYIYIDFLQRSTSFITLIAFDDPNYSGTSVTVSESTYKQQLKTAMQLTDDQDVQDVIDLAYDKLTNNFNVFRLQASSSIGEVVFYTTSKPLATITVAKGTIVSTTATSVTPAINFATQAEVSMIITSIDQYYNDALQRYEVVAPVQAIDAGKITNVSTNSIINSTFSQFQVTNVKPTENGQDRESNTHLAQRAMLAFTSVDTGTKNGYLKTVIGSQYIDDVLIVDAGHVLMQRDFDEVREKHVYGKVDIYIKGSTNSSFSETFGFLFNGAYRETASIIDVSKMRIGVTNPEVTVNYPLYLIQEIINVTKAVSYDLTGNYTLYKNAATLSKSNYTLDLSTGNIVLEDALITGDSLTGDYQYKIDVLDEVTLAAAGGGEISVTLNIPLTLGKKVALFTEVIYLIRTNVVSVDQFNDTITILPQHVYKTGDIVRISSTGSMPGPLISGVDYYVICVSNTVIKLASSLDRANDNVAIDILNSGVGSITISPSTAITLVRDTDYTIDYATGQVFFLFSSFPTGLFASDSIKSDYEYIENVVGEIIIASAVGGETTAALINNNIVEAYLIEPSGIIVVINTDNVINSLIGLAITDLIRITYKYRKANEIVLSNQPVDSIVSVTTSTGVILTENVHYKFNKADDLLLDGNSIRATRSITLLYDEASNLPTGELLSTNDNVSLVALEYSYLSKKGIDENTIVVTDLTGTITYVLFADYVVVPGTPLTQTLIARSSTTTIGNGQTVIVSYNYGEPITVVYLTNLLVKTVQNKVDIMRHITADVLVKQANKIDIELEFTVKLFSGANAPVVKDQISTNLYSFISQKKLGSRVSQSDIISIIDNNDGVDYIILPLTKMIVADNTHIAYELLVDAVWTVHQVSTVTIYKAENTLNYSTAGSNSDSSLFWRISEDDIELQLVSSITDVGLGAGRALIDSDGTIYMSTRFDDNPSGHEMTVAYNVSGETGAKDIIVTDLDYMNLKSLVIYTI